MSTKGERQKEHERGARQVQVQVVKHVHYPQFFVGDVIAQPDGSRVVQFILPTGEVHAFPLGADAAQDLGRKLTAPSIEVAAAGDLPPTNGTLH